jgi:plastocyanin
MFLMKTRVFAPSRSFIAATFGSLLILMLILSACGGGDSTSSSSSTTPSSSNSGSSSGASSSSAPAQTILVKESKAAGQADVYTCSPKDVTVKTGSAVTFTNQTDEVQEFDQGQETQAGIALKLTLNQSQTVTFNTAGTFLLKSTKNAAVTVIVQ